MVLTAFEAWVNELIGVGRMMGLISMDEIAFLIDEPSLINIATQLNT